VIKVCQNAFHAEKSLGGGVEATPSPATDSEIFVEMIGLPNTPKINELNLTIYRSIGYNNAAACFQDERRTIVYDPAWAKTATVEAYLVLAHEAGHHFCGHTLGTIRTTPREAELEADLFSGASIKRFEVYHGKAFLEDALKAAGRLYSEAGSRSHPPRAARIEAIVQGYNSNSPCGNLAAGIRGYSRQPR
jgi:Zn-dependent protease with chaperone function